MSEDLTFLWNIVKNHLDLKGLEDVAIHYPEFSEEAAKLAAPKRLVGKFVEIVRNAGNSAG